MWAQGMSFNLNIMQEHFKATNYDQNWTSHFEHGCLNLDNVYDRNVSLLIIQVTKNNSAFFISSRNLKNDSLVKTLIACFSSIVSLDEKTGEEWLLSNSTFASLWRILVIALSKCCTNPYNLKQILRNQFR